MHAVTTALPGRRRTLTLAEALRADAAYLSERAVPEARGLAECLVSGVLDCRRLKLGLRLDEPLDWRLPETHAVYWAYRGLGVGKVRSLGCDRMVFQSMAALFRQGRMIVDARGKRLILLPDTELVFRTIQAYEWKSDF